MVETKISIGFFDFRQLSSYKSLAEEDLDYYRKYEGGNFRIISGKTSLIIEHADLHYLLLNLFLRWIPKIFSGNNLLGTLMEKEGYGLYIFPLPNGKIKIQEYDFTGPEKTSRDHDEITQEVVVAKIEFIKEIYLKILEFIVFYEEVTGKDLKYWDADLEIAKIAIGKANIDV